VLWQEIRARGYPGGYSSVRNYLTRFRGNGPIAAPAPQPPKPRTVTAWIMTRPDRLDPGEKASLDAILASSPELTALTAHVRACAALMTQRRGRDLEQWMTAATASGEPALRSFVTGLRADQDARPAPPPRPPLRLTSPGQVPTAHLILLPGPAASGSRQRTSAGASRHGK
jgi:hypothetical protein